MTYKTAIIISPQHPSLAGHFPGRPVIPAVVILEEIIDMVQQRWQSHYWVSDIPVVKFLRPWPPGQLVTLSLTANNMQHIKFLCTWQGDNLVKGELILTQQGEKNESFLVSGT